ncbi:MmcQ/YjbR family DNA-binding protein [Streptomyces chattanoogensis]
MATIEEVRQLARSLPRTVEAVVRDRVKFRVGRIVYISFSKDETTMGFSFPKGERAAVIASEPEKFRMPAPTSQRFNWLEARLDALDATEMEEIVIEAWRMVVPKSVAADRLRDTRFDRDAQASALPSLAAPSPAELRDAARVFNGFNNIDASWLRLLDTTQPALDLSEEDHRTALLRWLNSWGCRIRYPREGEPAPFNTGVEGWWHDCGAELPAASLAALSDRDISTLARAYAKLAALPVASGPRARSLGPTAAAKALYALRPRGVMPWDSAIAGELHGARDAAAFGNHLRLGRSWAQSLLRVMSVAEEGIPEAVGRPSVSLAKILDEYLYVKITMAEPR